MTEEKLRELKTAIEANVHLFSARYNKDYQTMAIEINLVRAAEDRVSEVDCHLAMLLP